MKKAFFQLHTAVLLFGLTAILGDLIDLSSVVLVWWRLIIATLSIVLLFNIVPKIRKLPRQTLLRMFYIGTILAVHWLFFFGSVKLANASIALLCMATTSFFTALLDPIFTRKPVRRLDVLMGFVMLPGIALVVQADKLGRWEGLIVGLIAAILGAFYSILNKPLVNRINPFVINGIELGSGAIILGVCVGIAKIHNPNLAILPPTDDWIFLILLGLACTTFAYFLFLSALRSLSAFTANFSVNLEPVYGIILAYFILGDHEELSSGFYWGGLLIIAALFIHAFFDRRLS